MTYDEAMNSGNKIFWAEAKYEIEKHGLSFEDFQSDYGDEVLYQ